MYQEYFGLLEQPFSIAPDPRYLYMSERHREALAHLLYGLDSDGAFILLSGDVGTGKTTVSRCLLDQVPEQTNLALVLNPKLSSMELLQVICDELGISYESHQINCKNLVDLINRYLLEMHASGKKTVVLIEESQNLQLDVLEQLRLLTNLETNERKLLQVILLGQPELLEILDRPELSQLAQRITARFHLSPLNQKEVSEYIAHRLAVAGCRRPLFSAGVSRLIYRYSKGVPRLINVICDRALLGCFVQNQHQVTPKIVRQAATEVLGENRADQITHGVLKRRLWQIMAAAVLLISVFALGMYFSPQSASKHPFLVELHNSLLNPVPQSDSIKPIEEVMPDEIDEPVVLEGKPLLEMVSSEEIIWTAEDSLRLRSNLLSYQALFAQWGLKYQQVDGTPCFYAQTQGLACHHERTDLNGLRNINRPVILKLYDDYNQPQYVALLSMDNDFAELDVVGRRQNVSLAQLKSSWRGELSMLWRPPAGYSELVKPGSEGPFIIWLSKTMNRINNTPQLAISSYYRGDLVKRVKQFQLSRGLIDDGVVGVRTLIEINRALGLESTVDEPALEKGS